MPQKRSEATPAEKILSLYTLLLFNPGRAFSLTDLAKRLECSKQTVSRIVVQIEAANFGKIARREEGREVFYFIEKPKSLPQVRLNVEGLYQLALCRNLLLHLIPKGMRKKADGVLRSAGAYADGDVASDDVSIGQAYTKGRIDYSPFQGLLETFISAMRNKRVCRVTYKTRLRKERTMSFAPKRLITYHETVLIQGWEVTPDGEASALYENPMPLYLHRCLEVCETGRDAGNLPEPKAAQDEEGNGLFGIIQGEPFSVAAHFAPEAASYVAERQWSSRQKIEEHPDGSITLAFEAQSETEVLSWLFSFGDKVTVQKPEWLRKDLLEQAKAIAGKYAAASNENLNAGL